MESLYLVKIGEIALKQGNRPMFINRLKKNILDRVASSQADFFGHAGRYFLSSPESDEEEVMGILGTTFGVTWYGRAFRCDKNLEAVDRCIITAAEERAEQKRAASFKIEARRADKSFPLTSYELACRYGDLITAKFPDFTVDVHNPDWTIHCEVRDKVIVYSGSREGPGGLPVGTAGKAMLLLSGGIDSPVAGFLMAKRGLKLDAVYFHTHPFTPPEAKEKVESITSVLASYNCGASLFTVPFTDVIVHIKEHAREEELTLLLRAAMMSFAEKLGRKRGCSSLVTGEALSQVASQTVASLGFTDSIPEMPVFRPLIGYDKEEIITLAKKFGTFDISILPYADCCTLFAPRRPLVRPDKDKMLEAYRRLELGRLLHKALDHTELKKF